MQGPEAPSPQTRQYIPGHLVPAGLPHQNFVPNPRPELRSRVIAVLSSTANESLQELGFTPGLQERSQFLEQQNAAFAKRLDNYVEENGKLFADNTKLLHHSRELARENDILREELRQHKEKAGVEKSEILHHYSTLAVDYQRLVELQGKRSQAQQQASTAHMHGQVRPIANSSLPAGAQGRTQLQAGVQPNPNHVSMQQTMAPHPHLQQQRPSPSTISPHELELRRQPSQNPAFLPAHGQPARRSSAGYSQIPSQPNPTAPVKRVSSGQGQIVQAGNPFAFGQIPSQPNPNAAIQRVPSGQGHPIRSHTHPQPHNPMHGVPPPPSGSAASSYPHVGAQAAQGWPQPQPSVTGHASRTAHQSPIQHHPGQYSQQHAPPSQQYQPQPRSQLYTSHQSPTISTPGVQSGHAQAQQPPQYISPQQSLPQPAGLVQSRQQPANSAATAAYQQSQLRARYASHSQPQSPVQTIPISLPQTRPQQHVERSADPVPVQQQQQPVHNPALACHPPSFYSPSSTFSPAVPLPATTFPTTTIHAAGATFSAPMPNEAPAQQLPPISIPARSATISGTNSLPTPPNSGPTPPLPQLSLNLANFAATGSAVEGGRPLPLPMRLPTESSTKQQGSVASSSSMQSSTVPIASEVELQGPFEDPNRVETTATGGIPATEPMLEATDDTPPLAQDVDVDSPSDSHEALTPPPPLQSAREGSLKRGNEEESDSDPRKRPRVAGADLTLEDATLVVKIEALEEDRARLMKQSADAYEDEYIEVDAEGKRTKEDCLKEIFLAEEAGLCHICKLRAERTKDETVLRSFADTTLDERIAHCENEHRAAWEFLRNSAEGDSDDESE
ncbi:hypothetical protein MKEN_00096100 [Mycena kentingensis (nom. inval.)]|nr:hypothetical protein MKEN_00096100 [Mycena kentingensis (nom. inval.)]